MGGLGGERCADDPAGVPNDERHLFRGGMNGGDHDVALVLAIVIVGDDDKFAACERLDHGVDLMLAFQHESSPSQRAGGANGQAGASPICPR